MNLRKTWAMYALAALVLLVWTVGPAVAAEQPNLLVIWGDDVGVHNISAYNHGIMGYKTPNIDRTAGHWYAGFRPRYSGLSANLYTAHEIILGCLIVMICLNFKPLLKNQVSSTWSPRMNGPLWT